MRLNAPKQITWWIGLVVGVVGVLSNFVSIPFFSDFSFWLVVIAWVLMQAATYVKGL
jgi:hypothetical protein